MSKRILIIDDEENIRRVTRLTLEAAGYEVGEAANGQQGLDLYVDGSSWDVVLLDQRMPGIFWSKSTASQKAPAPRIAKASIPLPASPTS